MQNVTLLSILNLNKVNDKEFCENYFDSCREFRLQTIYLVKTAYFLMFNMRGRAGNNYFDVNIT